MPRSASIRGQGGRPPRDPPAPTRRAAGGIGGKLSRGGCGLLSKGGARQAWHGRQATNPLWGFPLATTLLAPAWREKGTRRRRDAPDEGGAGNRSKYTDTAGNAYHATPSPSSTRLRLHRRPTVSTARPLYSLLPLGLLPVLAPRTSRRVAVNLLPGCWPFSRRTAAPRRMELLGRSCS
jgi:hypothetical protein